MSRKISVERSSGRLLISYNWRGSAMWFMVLWCVIWNGSILFALFNGAGWFIVLHLLAGIFVTLFTLTRFCNKTTIAVDRTALTIRHGPVPWPFSKNQHIPARSLRQLYVQKGTMEQNNQPTYQLIAILDTDARVKLLAGETDLDLLQDLESAIEGYLNIENDASFDLSRSGRSPEELATMLAQIAKARQAASNRSWMPEFVTEQLRKQEERIKQALSKNFTTPLDEDATSSSAPTNPPASARPFPPGDSAFGFPLYALADGKTAIIQGTVYRLRQSTQIDWQDEAQNSARQLEMTDDTTANRRSFYAHTNQDRWRYYEERRLSETEVNALGFTENEPPPRLQNGDDRYYPYDQETGVRFLSGYEQTVVQYIYATSRSATRFRALRPEHGEWEVYVMEPFDHSNFDAA